MVPTPISMHVSYFQYKLDILGNIMQVLWVLDTFLLDFVITSTSIIIFWFVFWWRTWVIIQPYFNEAWSPRFEKPELVYWIKDMQVVICFPGGSAGKETTCNAGDLGSIPGGENPLEKGRATHSSILAWRILWTIQSVGLQRVRRNWATFTFIGFGKDFLSRTQKSRQ